jgi:NADPH:quinone reductase-like Zn-dependent oxidoreductase
MAKEIKMHAAQLVAYGDPIKGLEYATIPEPGKPGKDEALIGVEFSPINPNDLMVAEGIYAHKPTLPSVIGNEGVGSVLEVGENVRNVKKGDRVLLPLSGFVWRERMLVPAANLFALPQNADPQQLSMLGINPPTAALITSEFVDLKPGDWVIQNAANSGVGRWVLAFAKERGFKTVNIVRRPELVSELKELGADVVIVSSTSDLSGEVKDGTGGKDIRLGLDGISGAATGVIASQLGMHATLVVYAAMSESASSINPLDLIFKSLWVKGFWMGHPEYAEKIPAAVKEAANMLASGKVKIPVASVYPLSEIKEAVAHATRGGKVLLSINGSGSVN